MNYIRIIVATLLLIPSHIDAVRVSRKKRAQPIIQLTKPKARAAVAKRRHQCPACPKDYSTKGNLVTHMQSQHVKNPRRFKCQICSNTFAKNSGVKEHEKRIHQGVPYTRDFVCKVCRKAFTKKYNLNRHEDSKLHKNAVSASFKKLTKPQARAAVGKRHQCPECPNNYSRKCNLDRHKRSQHLSKQPPKQETRENPSPSPLPLELQAVPQPLEPPPNALPSIEQLESPANANANGYNSDADDCPLVPFFLRFSDEQLPTVAANEFLGLDSLTSVAAQLVTIE